MLWNTHSTNTQTCTGIRNSLSLSTSSRRLCISTTASTFTRDGNITLATLVITRHPRTVQIATNKDAIIAAVLWEPWKISLDIAREFWVPQQNILEILLDDQLDKCHFSWNAFFFRRLSSAPLVRISMKQLRFDHLPFAIWRWRVSRNLIVSGYTLYNVFQIVLKRTHTTDSLCASLFFTLLDFCGRWRIYDYRALGEKYCQGRVKWSEIKLAKCHFVCRRSRMDWLAIDARCRLIHDFGN